jgi:hypothetical protein
MENDSRSLILGTVLWKKNHAHLLTRFISSQVLESRRQYSKRKSAVPDS